MKRMLSLLAALVAPLAVSAPAAAAGHTVTVAQHGGGPAWQGTYYWVVYGHRGDISGTVSATGAGRGVDLLASQFPYTHGFSRVAHTQTTAGGRYGFAVRPSVATRYRVRAAGVTSRTVTFYVGVRFSLLTQSICPERNGTCHGTVTYDTWYPSSVGAEELARKAYLYIGVAPGAARPASLTRRTSFTQTDTRLSPTEWHSTLHFTYASPPTGAWYMAWAWCTRTIESQDGFGLPVGTGCGGPSLPNQTVRLELLG